MNSKALMIIAIRVYSTKAIIIDERQHKNRYPQWILI